MNAIGLLGEGQGKHHHSYQGTETGHWLWCGECQCFVTTPCNHEGLYVCRERSEYIRLKRKYEPEYKPHMERQEAA